MQLLHTIPSLVPESGGTARSVTGLATALAKQGHKVEILSLDMGPRFGAPILPTAADVHTTFVSNRVSIGQRQLWSPLFGKILRDLIHNEGINLVHDHCVWLPTHLSVVSEAQHARLPLVVSTRGMLEPWALNHNRLRKQLMWHLYQKRTLAKADLLHATALSEAQSLRKLNLQQPIAIIPNAVDSMPGCNVDQAESRSTRTILFLSRIHPKKGLLNLINALGQLAIGDWEILIVGPHEGSYLSEVQACIAANHLKHKVKFMGPVEDHAKWQYYQMADLFVLPSFSENFGIVIAEALASGVPVITTTGTPWQELVTTQSGWWVEPTVQALAEALRDAMQLTDEERRQMGMNGRQLVQQRYSWQMVATKMLAVYQWLLGRSDIPECVHLEKQILLD